MSLILNVHSFLDTSAGFTINETQHYGLNWLKMRLLLFGVIKQNQAFNQRGDSRSPFTCVASNHVRKMHTRF